MKIVAQAIRTSASTGRGSRAYVHANTFNIPGYAFPLRWTAWGELSRPQVQFAVLTRGPPPERGLNTAGHLVAESAVQVAAADALSSG